MIDDAAKRAEKKSEYYETGDDDRSVFSSTKPKRNDLQAINCNLSTC